MIILGTINHFISKIIVQMSGFQRIWPYPYNYCIKQIVINTNREGTYLVPSFSYLKKYPVSGELALAIRLRGIRPAKNASRPASTAFFIAEAIKIGF